MSVCLSVCVGQRFVVYTPARYFGERDFYWLATYKTSFAFTVTACEEAVVSISNGTAYVYEVVLGAEGNSLLEIRDLSDEGTVASVTTTNILNCNIERSFWIENTGERIVVGSGRINEIVLLDMLVPSLNMRAVGLSTRGFQGVWSVSQNAGSSVT